VTHNGGGEAILELVGLPDSDPLGAEPSGTRIALEIASEEAPRLARQRGWLARRGVEVVFAGRGPVFQAVNIATSLGLAVRLLPVATTPAEDEALRQAMELFLRSPHVRVPIEPFHTVTLRLVHDPEGRSPTLFDVYHEAAAPPDVRCAGCPAEPVCAGFLTLRPGGCGNAWREMFAHLARAAAEIRAGLAGTKSAPSPTPVAAHVLVSFSCNNDCVFCAPGHKQRAPSPEGSLERARASVRRAAAAGVRSLALSGAGEPTLLPELRELVALARAEGIPEVTVFTNGSRPDLIERLVAAGATGFLLSLHGPPAIHDAVVRREGAHASALATLGAIRGCDVPVTLNTVLTRPLLGELHAFALSVAGERACHVLCYPEWAGHALENLALIPTLEEVAAALAGVAWADGPPGLVVDNVPLCLLGSATPRHVPATHALHLDAQGETAFTEGLNCGHNLWPELCTELDCPRRAGCPGVDRAYAGHRDLRPLRALAEPVVAKWRGRGRAASQGV
jgi:pyruvate-formate lyase-activating enzyme